VKKINNKRELQAKKHSRGLRMKELTLSTGLPKSAILHYLAQGLLPEPLKTSPNMAYYDSVCIERIKFIKEMQARYSFPLSRIKLLLSLKDQGKDITPLVELNEIIFGSNDRSFLDETQFSLATSLHPKQIEELIREGLLLPFEKGIFDQYDVTIGKIYAQGFRQGVNVSDLIFYVKAAREIIDSEMRLRQRLTKDLPDNQDAELTGKLVQAARAVRNYVIDRVFQQRIASARNLKDEGLVS
jgi:DNA-binding transcriptional MerR regulator